MTSDQANVDPAIEDPASEDQDQSSLIVEVSTVADDEVVLHRGAEVLRFVDLRPDTEYVFAGVSVRTLPRPSGELLSTFATANDVHFGETKCGVFDGVDPLWVLSVEPEEEPYPEVMNGAAVREIAALEPDAVLVKGDLTDRGTAEEYARFVEVWGGAFGDKLHHVRGNHDAMVPGFVQGLEGIPRLIQLPGVRLALVDSVIPGSDTGRLSPETLAWLDDVAADADAAGETLLGFAHHHCWNPSSASRPDTYFGLHPDSSEALVTMVARHQSFAGWFAGHTHRNRVQRFASHCGEAPFVEVACLKDYPGSWAEYRVFEGGILQIHRRLSAPEALAWSNRCAEVLYGGQYRHYALGALHDRCFRVV